MRNRRERENERAPARRGRDGEARDASLCKTKGDEAMTNQMLLDLSRRTQACRACKLAAGARNKVFGEGPADAQLMLIGEGPGADEDATGRPFVGKAGQKLDEMLEHVGIDRSKIFIANMVKCRPPNNRKPEQDEMQQCWNHLAAQIRTIQPIVIVTLGNTPTQFLMPQASGITKERGTIYDVSHAGWSARTRLLIPTYHPSYVMRMQYDNTTQKAAEHDLGVAKAYLQQLGGVAW
jgi:DNA polymerase